MVSSFRARGPGGRRGFSLIELIVVLFIFGVAIMFGIGALNSAFKRQRVNSAAEEVKSLAGMALAESQSRNLQTFLVFGKYVAGVGTDVAIVADRPQGAGGTPGVLDEDYDPNGDGLFDDGAANVVLRRTRVPEDVYLVKPVDATPVEWAAAGDQVQWRVPPPPASTTPTFAAAILCDARGRAMFPGTADTIDNSTTPPTTISGNPPAMIPGPATIRFTHRDMVSGRLTPFVTYTVSIGPLFKASIARVP